MKGPQFLVYVNPILNVLKENGGAGYTSDVVDLVIEHMKISEEEVEQRIASGESRVRNRIQWARMYLGKAGYIDNSEKGTWKLTEKGMNANLSDQDIFQMYSEVQATFSTKAASQKGQVKTAAPEDELVTDEVTHSSSLLKILKGLSASGFERICKRLLLECKFKSVQVTGKSGDNGIDGVALLEINPVVTIKVLFQCKRYKESVGAPLVRDFRGAMQGRAEKGIIITTGYFTKEAKYEAMRDGVGQIELIDGERLVGLFEEHKLGLKPKKAYDIDLSFFDEFK